MKRKLFHDFKLPRATCRACGQVVTSIDAHAHLRRCTRRLNAARRAQREAHAKD